MATSRQRDLFQDDDPSDVDDESPTPEYRPDPDSVRDELHKILAEMRGAKKLPGNQHALLYTARYFRR